MMKKAELARAKHTIKMKMYDYREATQQELISLWNKRFPKLQITDAEPKELVLLLIFADLEEQLPWHKLSDMKGGKT